MTYKIIDGHVHLYPENLLRAVLRWFEKNEGWQMPYKWPAEKHIEYLNKMGIEEYIVLNYAHKPGISMGLNDWLAALTEEYPGIRPYACVYQDDENKTHMLKRFLDEKNFYGVKIHAFVQRVAVNDYRFSEVFKLLEERGKGLVLHASAMPVSVPEVSPEQVESLLINYPHMKIMVAHLGLPEHQEAYLRLIDKYDKLYLDTAFIFGNNRFKNTQLQATLKNYSHRIVYGSDFPVMDYSPKEAISEIKAFNLGADIEEKIFYKNAKNFMQS